MRVGEAIALDRNDLDTVHGLLTVHGKAGKTRQLPLHPSAVQALAGYYASCATAAIPGRGPRRCSCR